MQGLSASGCSCPAPAPLSQRCLQWLALCSPRACSPAAADWTLDPETDGFSSSAAISLVCYPQLPFRVKAEGENCLFVCAVSLRGGFIDGSPPSGNVSSPFSPVCPPSPTEESRVKVSWIFRSLKDKFMHPKYLSFASASAQTATPAPREERDCSCASSIKSLCSCNHGSETVRSHSDNQNKALPTATRREARF